MRVYAFKTGICRTFKKNPNSRSYALTSLKSQYKIRTYVRWRIYGARWDQISRSTTTRKRRLVRYNFNILLICIIFKFQNIFVIIIK